MNKRWFARKSIILRSEAVDVQVANPASFTVNSSQVARLADIPPPAVTLSNEAVEFNVPAQAFTGGVNAFIGISSMNPAAPDPTAGGITFTATQITLNKKGYYTILFVAEFTETAGDVTARLPINGVVDSTRQRKITDGPFSPNGFDVTWNYLFDTDAVRAVRLSLTTSANVNLLSNSRIRIIHQGFQ